MNILIESMTKFVHKIEPWMHYTIRCWRQEQGYSPEASAKSQAESIEAIQKMPKELSTSKKADKFEMAQAILMLDRMNAVEVVDESGSGCVVYKDWP